MLCSRCLLSFLALYMLLEETVSAAVLQSRNKREVSWLDQEVFSRLSPHSDGGDLSVGDEVEMGRDHSHSEAPTENLSVQRQRQSQFQYNRKVNDKRRKVAPLDSIGSFQMRTRKDEPNSYREDYRN